MNGHELVASTVRVSNSTNYGKIEIGGTNDGDYSLFIYRDRFVKSVDGADNTYYFNHATDQGGTYTLATTSDIPTNLNQLTNGPGYITSSSLSSYVPYTGATSDVNLGNRSLSASSIATVSGDYVTILTASGFSFLYRGSSSGSLLVPSPSGTKTIATEEWVSTQIKHVYRHDVEFYWVGEPYTFVYYSTSNASATLTTLKTQLKSGLCLGSGYLSFLIVDYWSGNYMYGRKFFPASNSIYDTYDVIYNISDTVTEV